MERTTSTEYTEEDIVVLEGLEPVRKRPSMYIGGVDNRGYHHLLWEIVDNSVDEVINGHASAIKVTLHKDERSVTVEDNGRGIPTGVMPKLNKPALEVILTTLHSGGKFEKKSYTHSGGLHGVGSSVVNALSEELLVKVKRESREVEQRYARGIPQTSMFVVGPTRTTGTSIFFRPDHQIFGRDAHFDRQLVLETLEAKTYLHKGLKIVFIDEGLGKKSEFLHQGGIQEYVEKLWQERQKPSLHPPLYLIKEFSEAQLKFEAAFCWTESTEEFVKSYANGIPTAGGGTHESAFKSGLLKGVRSYMETHELTPKGLSITSEDIREGVVGVLSCYLAEPQFQGQTKDRLNNPEIVSEIDSALRVFVEGWLNSNSVLAESIIARIILAARAREASRVANLAISRRSSNQRVTLPGKLADCSTSDPHKAELFIVEGDSAGGSAKQGRDRKIQAILPLRGKVLNAEQASQSKLLNNKELQDIISALGCGFGEDFTIEKLRYHRIFLLMDADSDGYHISTLLLTFFYRYLPKLIEAGHIYIAQPPLYRIDIGKESHWVLDDEAKEKLLASLKPNAKPEIQRFKGLGEMMPEQLWATTLDPKRRNALKVAVVRPLETDRVMNELMGKDSSARFRFIMENAQQANEIDI